MRLFSALLLLALLFSCGKNTGDEDVVAPAPPHFTIKAPDYAATESGIDAAPDGIYLEWTWDDEEDADLAGVLLYRSQHPDSVFQPLLYENQPLFIDKDTRAFVDTDIIYLEDPVRYYYYLTAVDENDNESTPSDTAHYRLWHAPENVMLWQPDSLSLQCRFEYYQNHQDVSGALLKFRTADTFVVRTISEIPLATVTVREWSRAELGLSMGNPVEFRVDILMNDETTFGIPSNPDSVSLSGAESAWVEAN